MLLSSSDEVSSDCVCRTGFFDSPKSLSFECQAYCVFCSIRVLLTKHPDCFHVKSFLKHFVGEELWLIFLDSTAEFMHVSER